MLVNLEKVIDTVIDYCEEEELGSVELTDRLEAMEPAKDLNELFELASRRSCSVKVEFSDVLKEWVVTVRSQDDSVTTSGLILYNVIKDCLISITGPIYE